MMNDGAGTSWFSNHYNSGRVLGKFGASCHVIAQALPAKQWRHR